MPLISVIIPTFNRGDSILGAIESVLKQKFEDWELIIVDDGSEDDTYEVIQQFLSDNRIKYFKQENKGVSAARNFGAILSQGKFLTFLDSDDMVSPNWLIDYSEIINNDESVLLVICGVKIFTENNKAETSIPAKKGKYNAPLSGTFLIKNEIFHEIGMYDEYLTYAENTELFFRLEQKSVMATIIENCNLTYYQSDSGGSKNPGNIINSTLHILDKHDSHLTNHIKFLYRQIVGVKYLRFGNFDLASEHLWIAWNLKRGSIKTFLRFLLSKTPFLSKIIYPVLNKDEL